MKKEFLTFTVLSTLFIVVYFLFPDLQDDIEKKDNSELNNNISQNKIQSKEINEVLIPLTFDIVRISKHGDAVIAGKSEPNTFIELLENDKVIASFFSDGNGDWVWVSDVPLEQGIKNFYLRFRDKDNVLHKSGQTVLVLEDNKNDEVKPAVAKFLTNDARVQILNLDSLEDGLSIDIANYYPMNKFTISGRTLPNHDVSLYQSDKLLQIIKSDEFGNWRFTSNMLKLLDGEIIISSKINDEIISLFFSKSDFNKKLDIDSLNFEDNQIVVKPGNSLWRIARKTLGEGIYFTEIYKSNIKRIKDPDLIYPGQVFDIPNLMKKISHE